MDEEKFKVAVTLIYKGNYDPMNQTLFPVADEDIRGEERKKEYVKTIYLDADQRTDREFRKHPVFYGRHLGKRYKVLPCQRYQDAVKELYDTFNCNNQLWTTVNTGYLDKFYDVYAEGAGADGDDVIDFIDYNRFIREDFMPIWNVERYTFDSVSLTKCLPITTSYEHEVQKRLAGEKDGYMAGYRDEIQAVIVRDDNVYIRTDTKEIQGWTAYRFVKDISIDSYGYERSLLLNYGKIRFDEYDEIRGCSEDRLRSRLCRYDIDHIVSCSNYQIVESEAIHESDGYFFADMNPFIEIDEKKQAARNVFVLDFSVGDTKKQLAEMVVRFIISQLQLEADEYRWAGRIIG